MKTRHLFTPVILMVLSLVLTGCPFGPKDDAPDPKPGTEPSTKVEVLKLDWDSASVSMEQTSRTVDNEANVLVIGSADACGGCKDWFLFAVIGQGQCGRDGWQCSSRGNVQINFENLSIGQESSLGWQVKVGGKLTISSIDGTPLIAGTTPTKNYQIKRIELESHNDTPSRNNGDIRIGTPECPAVNQNFLWQRRDEGDTRKLLTDLAAGMNSKKYALAVKVLNLNRWCASTSYVTDFSMLKGEKFTVTPPQTLSTGTGEFIGQDLADLLIADVENLYDYSHGSTYFWVTDEVEIVTGNRTIPYFKRKVAGDQESMDYDFVNLKFHFEDNDSILVLAFESFYGTWRFPDKEKYDRIVIDGRNKNETYGYDNVELKIDKLEKNTFNFTREIDITLDDLYGTGPRYDIEKILWSGLAEELQLPLPGKFKVKYKMVPYR